MIKSALHQKEPNFDRKSVKQFASVLLLCLEVFSFSEIVPILRSDPDPNECLRLLKKDLKNGPVKTNCLMLQEKYGANSVDPSRSTSERET